MNATEKYFRLDGEVAVVTGGGTGIGRAITEALAGAGARVAVLGRRREPLEETAAANKDVVFPFIHDVTDTGGAPGIVEKITRGVGTPTILVNNAGIHLKKAADQVTADDFRRILETHVVGAHALSAAVVPGMKKAGRGSILFIASMASLFGIPLVLPYSAAKTGHLGMVRAMAVEFGGDGIRVNAIAPGWIESPMMLKSMEGDPKRAEKVLGRTALRRFGEASDVGLAAVYLCSPAAKFVTGTCLVVDGGASIGF